ncbi:hypothetical protein DPMN_128174 [Dreissena polymorpha]|uniref:Uncharacterized protein n=1 Tax=Dreissena polymorpha TaxID=45954 RepID=A0A9D4H6M8_DREPO|nr:hypothetical protein DPMN_128174 [Dreissena polymorpha]
MLRLCLVSRPNKSAPSTSYPVPPKPPLRRSGSEQNPVLKFATPTPSATSGPKYPLAASKIAHAVTQYPSLAAHSATAAVCDESHDYKC